MVLFNEGLTAINNSRLCRNIEDYPLALEDIAITFDNNMSLGKGVIRGLIQRHAVCRYDTPGKCNNHTSLCTISILSPVIRDAVSLDGNRSFYDRYFHGR